MMIKNIEFAEALKISTDIINVQYKHVKNNMGKYLLKILN